MNIFCSFREILVMVTISIAKKKVYRRRSENCIYSNVALSMASHCSCVKLSYCPGERTNITDIGTAICKPIFQV